ncbi:MAG: NAD(P)H-hydrate dehydratase [Gammaproteobacteria bacterium]
MIIAEAGSPLFDEPGVRALDHTAITGAGIPGVELMNRAGAACLRAMIQRWPGMQRIAVVCGSGNNAGDGYVVARLARQAGHRVRVLQLGDTSRLGADARACYDAMCDQGVKPEAAPELTDWPEIIVDALFGIGLARPLEGAFKAMVERINSANVPVVSIDIPSGIDANRGVRLGAAVQAALTVTFIGVKQGLYTGDGPAHCGEIVFDDLAVPSSVTAAVAATAALLARQHLVGRFAPRSRTSHKGNNGHVLIIGGAPGFSGAARLAGEAACRVGAGLVSVALHPDSVAGANSGRPELMIHAIANGEALQPLLRRASVVAIGPGLGQSAWATQLMSLVLDQDRPLVVDADALNLIAREPVALPHAVLTPHPGEAARLLGLSTAAIHADRFAAAAALHQRYRGVVVLKGAGTIVADDGMPTVIGAGNPGMGGGGMGDVLTGVIAGLVAQGASPGDAARFGACVHAVAGDRAARAGERGLLAGDLMPHLRALVN